MGCRSGQKLNLSQAIEIRTNGYRTRDARHDYQAEEVDDRIIFLQSTRDARASRKVASLWSSMPMDPLAEIVEVLPALPVVADDVLPPTPEEEGIIDEPKTVAWNGHRCRVLANGFSLQVIDDNEETPF